MSELLASIQGVVRRLQHVYLYWLLLQRLFSTFANGWPGKGLILLRLSLAVYLLSDCFAEFDESASPTQQMLRIIGATAGLFILVGLWTPIASVLAALVEVWTAMLQFGNTWAALLAVALGLGLALIGPGAYSVDAVNYGRKRISINKT